MLLSKYQDLWCIREVVVNLVFLNQNYLVQHETLRALRKLPGVRVIALDIVPHPTADQASLVVSILKREMCRIIFTVNEWGIDSGGVLLEYIEKNSVIHINWCVDDPFYEEIMGEKKYRPYQYRIDFVSDRDYLPAMRARGYSVDFLPLATDPSLYFPVDCAEERKVVFVGNSYVAQIDKFVKSVFDIVLPEVPFLASLLTRHKKDCSSLNLEMEIQKHVQTLNFPERVSFDRVVFVCKQITGYLYRKELISYCTRHVNGFQIFGDAGWRTLFPKLTIGQVWYGDELRQLYNSVNVNLDCNRAVISDGFTQRVFDVCACRKFVITSAKPIAIEMFETEGAQKELVMFKNQQELVDLISYYSNNENERHAVALRGYYRIMHEHTYDHRIKQLFSTVSSMLALKL